MTGKGKECLYLILGLVAAATFLLFPGKVLAETREEYERRPRVEREAIKSAALRSGLGLESYLEKLGTPPPRPETFVFKVPLLAIPALLVFVGVGLLSKRRRKVEGEDTVEKRNDIRRGHLHMLQGVVESYYEREQMYPNEEVFEILRSKKYPDLLDPKEGIERETGGRFGYKYSRRNPVTEREDPRYYCLWCWLEGEEGKYSLEAEITDEYGLPM